MSISYLYLSHVYLLSLSLSSLSLRLLMRFSLRPTPVEGSLVDVDTCSVSDDTGEGGACPKGFYCPLGSSKALPCEPGK